MNLLRSGMGRWTTVPSLYKNFTKAFRAAYPAPHVSCIGWGYHTARREGVIMSAATLVTGSNPPQKTDVLRSKPRTLVVDDSLTILHAICTLLEHHEVVDLVGRAESGEETLDRALALGPDLVLIDADMPGMSGLRTALMLSQLCPAIKVVLMTMDRNPVILRAGSSCGAYAVIYKPRFLSELAEVLNNDSAWLSNSGAREQRKTNQRTATIMR